MESALFWQILLFLGETLNFTFKLVETESFGIWNTTSKSWNGLMESLVDNQSDFAITELAILNTSIHIMTIIMMYTSPHMCDTIPVIG